MDTASPFTRALATRLLAVEAASDPVSRTHVHEAERVCDKLRLSLTRFAGAEGFSSLLRRALALARAEVPVVQGVQIKPDCSMEGLDRLGRKDLSEAGAAITGHLLGLLETFIGGALTLRLVREAWPEAELDT